MQKKKAKSLIIIEQRKISAVILVLGCKIIISVFSLLKGSDSGFGGCLSDKMPLSRSINYGWCCWDKGSQLILIIDY